jgi:hypothetical protein
VDSSACLGSIPDRRRWFIKSEELRRGLNRPLPLEPGPRHAPFYITFRPDFARARESRRRTVSRDSSGFINRRATPPAQRALPDEMKDSAAHAESGTEAGRAGRRIPPT